MTKRARLGEILLRKGWVRHDQIHFLLEIQKTYAAVGRSIPIGDLLITHRILSNLQVTEALFIQEENAPESLQDFISAIRFLPS